jgi:predicted NodU family carbamoyl transferase/peptidoglycan/xylan/chitin deacetylase (PgdA/CDA1 family)
MQGNTEERKQLPRAVVHVDLDGATHIYRTRGWRYDYPNDPLFTSGLKNLLSFLDHNNIKATFFTIASDLDAPQKRELLKEAVHQGHEIASHSLTHSNFSELSRDRKRVEIAESREKLETILDTPVKGFRTPRYHIDRDCLELLEEYDYQYDSSVFPTWDFAKRLEIPTVHEGPHRPIYDLSIMELPLPKYKPAPFPFHPSYSLILGHWYFKRGLLRFRKTGLPLVLLFHLTDFADPLPREHLNGRRSRILTISHLPAKRKLKRCQAMIDLVRKHYQLTGTLHLLDQHTQSPQQKQPLIMAISTTHETGTAIFEGSTLKAAMSEERFDRVKFSTHYPPHRSINEAIRVSGVDPQEIRDVVIAGLPASKLLPVVARGQLRDFTEFHGWNDYFPHLCKALYRSFSFYRTLSYGSVSSFFKKQYGFAPRLHFVEHHQAHASAAYRTAPFDKALIVTFDGVGDDISLTISMGENGRIERLKEIPYPHSFGQFYTACTQVLGFRANRHEGKITGLSGFGKVDPELYKKVKSTIRRSGPDFTLDKRFYSEGIVRGFAISKIRGGEDLFDALKYRNYKKPLKKLLQGYQREDVAAVFQQLLEDEMVAVVRPYAEATGLKNLALCGGVFANVKLNDSLFRRLGMEQVYIFPHMGDGGLCVGAALEFLQTRPTPFDSVYWGPGFSENELEAALVAAADQGLHYRREKNIEKMVAELLVKDKVVARFNGRMEFGPRALGNRSILYNSSDHETNNWLNKRLGRTEFMPFAPVALAEKVDLLFKDIKGTEHACKFMTIILECTDFTKENCPAIVPGIPLLVNTSFNMHEEPIVCTAQDAIRAFLTSRLDYLAMGPFLAWL